VLSIWALHPSRAISNHRLSSFADGQVTFRWRDSAHNNEQKLLTLTVDKIPAPIFVARAPERLRAHPELRFPANAGAPRSCHFAFHLLGAAPQTEQDISDSKTQVIFGSAPSVVDDDVIERLTATEIQLRSPPHSLTAAA